MRNKTRSVSLLLATLGALFMILTITGCGQDSDAVSKEIPADKSNMKGKKQLDYLSVE